MTDTIEAKIPKWRRKLPVLLLAPYLIGIIWHALHPIVSVFTGHTQPRRWYIDENSLEPSYFKMNLQFEPLKTKGWKRRSLCTSVSSKDTKISCTEHPDGLEILKITPTIGAIRPVTEAIVLVVPWKASYVSDSFQVAVVYLIHLLEEANWLGKSVFIVSDTDPLQNLSATVDRFLNVYLGPVDGMSFRPPLPMEFHGYMLRNLLVLNVQPNPVSSPLHEICILAQGKRGVLPNMDLTFLSMFVFSRTHSMRTRKAVLVMHPYRDQTQQIQDTIQPKLPKELHEWFPKLLELLAFEFSLLLGPFPPHATALDRGIDALTIDARLAPNEVSDRVTTDVVQRLEYVVRALSNLHERLHHSTSLYLLVSPERFVKHEEYLVPNLLLLIPLVIRAISLVLFDIHTFQWTTVKYTVLLTLVSTAMLHYTLLSKISQDNIILAFIMIYVILTLFLHFGLPRSLSRQTIQFVACMMSLLVHVPITFGHVSLSFPSALFWTPLIAFPSLTSEDGKETTIKKFISFFLYALSAVAIMLTLPCFLLVPWIFPDYTVYVRYGYMPLHLLCAILYLS